jgi:hypothetical protein
VLCEGSTATYSVQADENATGYNWQTTATTTLVNNNTLEILAGTQDFFISIQAENDCGVSNYITLTVAVPETNTSPANFDGDCIVSDNDMQLLLNNYGCTENCSAFDLNGDGYIGVEDVMLFIEYAPQ